VRIEVIPGPPHPEERLIQEQMGQLLAEYNSRLAPLVAALAEYRALQAPRYMLLLEPGEAIPASMYERLVPG
jgi:hypothetical protein